MFYISRKNISILLILVLTIPQNTVFAGLANPLRKDRELHEKPADAPENPDIIKWAQQKRGANLRVEGGPVVAADEHVEVFNQEMLMEKITFINDLIRAGGHEWMMDQEVMRPGQIAFDLVHTNADGSTQIIGRIGFEADEDGIYHVAGGRFMEQVLSANQWEALSFTNVGFATPGSDEATNSSLRAMVTLASIQEDDVRLNPNVVIIRDPQESLEAKDGTQTNRLARFKISSFPTGVCGGFCVSTATTYYYSEDGVLMGSKETVTQSSALIFDPNQDSLMSITWKNAQGQILSETHYSHSFINAIQNALGNNYSVTLTLVNGVYTLQINAIFDRGDGLINHPVPGMLTSLTAVVQIVDNSLGNIQSIAANFEGVTADSGLLLNYLSQFRITANGLLKLAQAHAETSPQGTLYLIHSDGTADRLARLTQAGNSRIIATSLNAAELATVRELESYLPSDMQVRAVRQANGTLRVLIGAANLGQGTALTGEFSNLSFTIRNDGSLDLSLLGAAYNSGYNHLLNIRQLFDGLQSMMPEQNCDGVYCPPRSDLWALANMAQIRIVMFNVNGFSVAQGNRNVVGFILGSFGYRMQIENNSPVVYQMNELPALVTYLNQLQADLGARYTPVVTGWSETNGFEVTLFEPRRRVIIADGALRNISFNVHFWSGNPVIYQPSLTFQSANGLALTADQKNKFVWAFRHVYTGLPDLEFLRQALAVKILDRWSETNDGQTTEHFYFRGFGGREVLVSLTFAADNQMQSIAVVENPLQAAIENLLAAFPNESVTIERLADGTIRISYAQPFVRVWHQGDLVSFSLAAKFVRGRLEIFGTPTFVFHSFNMDEELADVFWKGLQIILADKSLPETVNAFKDITFLDVSLTSSIGPGLEPSRVIYINFRLGSIAYEVKSENNIVSVQEISRVMDFGSAALLMGMTDESILLLQEGMGTNFQLPETVTFHRIENKIKWVDAEGIYWTIQKLESETGVSFQIDSKVPALLAIAKIQQALASFNLGDEQVAYVQSFLDLLRNRNEEITLQNSNNVPSYSWVGLDGYTYTIQIGLSMPDGGVLPNIYASRKIDLSRENALAEMSDALGHLSAEDRARFEQSLGEIPDTITKMETSTTTVFSWKIDERTTRMITIYNATGDVSYSEHRQLDQGDIRPPLNDLGVEFNQAVLLLSPQARAEVSALLNQNVIAQYAIQVDPDFHLVSYIIGFINGQQLTLKHALDTNSAEAQLSVIVVQEEFLRSVVEANPALLEELRVALNNPEAVERIRKIYILGENDYFYQFTADNAVRWEVNSDGILSKIQPLAHAKEVALAEAMPAIQALAENLPGEDRAFLKVELAKLNQATIFTITQNLFNGKIISVTWVTPEGYNAVLEEEAVFDWEDLLRQLPAREREILNDFGVIHFGKNTSFVLTKNFPGNNIGLFLESLFFSMLSNENKLSIITDIAPQPACSWRYDGSAHVFQYADPENENKLFRIAIDRAGNISRSVIEKIDAGREVIVKPGDPGDPGDPNPRQTIGNADRLFLAPIPDIEMGPETISLAIKLDLRIFNPEFNSLQLRLGNSTFPADKVRLEKRGDEWFLLLDKPATDGMHRLQILSDIGAINQTFNVYVRDSLLGDIDHNGMINAADLDALTAALQNPTATYNYGYDIDQDGVVDSYDQYRLASYLNGTLQLDLRAPVRNFVIQTTNDALFNLPSQASPASMTEYDDHGDVIGRPWSFGNDLQEMEFKGASRGRLTFRPFTLEFDNQGNDAHGFAGFESLDSGNIVDYEKVRFVPTTDLWDPPGSQYPFTSGLREYTTYEILRQMGIATPQTVGFASVQLNHDSETGTDRTLADTFLIMQRDNRLKDNIPFMQQMNFGRIVEASDQAYRGGDYINGIDVDLNGERFTMHFDQADLARRRIMYTLLGVGDRAISHNEDYGCVGGCEDPNTAVWKVIPFDFDLSVLNANAGPTNITSILGENSSNPALIQKAFEQTASVFTRANLNTMLDSVHRFPLAGDSALMANVIKARFIISALQLANDPQAQINGVRIISAEDAAFYRDELVRMQRSNNSQISALVWGINPDTLPRFFNQ